MPQKNNRYQKMVQIMTGILALDLLLFILYLISAGMGITWAKVITAIFSILISGAVLGYLYLSKELLRPRSRWMSAAGAAILICTLISLITVFPRPKFTLSDTNEVSAPIVTVDTSSDASVNKIQ